MGNLIENLVGNSHGKYLQENLAGNVAENCCGKIMQEIVAGKSCMIGIGSENIPWENLVGNSVVNLVGNSVINLVRSSCGKSCRKF